MTFSAAARAARKGVRAKHHAAHHPRAKGKAHPHKGHKGPHPGAVGKAHPHHRRAH